MSPVNKFLSEISSDHCHNNDGVNRAPSLNQHHHYHSTNNDNTSRTPRPNSIMRRRLLRQAIKTPRKLPSLNRFIEFDSEYTIKHSTVNGILLVRKFLKKIYIKRRNLKRVFDSIYQQDSKNETQNKDHKKSEMIPN